MRTFLSIEKKLFLLLAVLITICSIANAQTPGIGVELYSFRAQLARDVPGTLQKIRKMGFTEVEGGGSYGMDPGEFKSLLDKIGLKMVSIGADFKQLAENPEEVAQQARLFGAKYVVCFWIPHEEKGFTIDDAKNAVEVFNAAGNFLREKGISLCYHPHGYEFGPYENGTLFDYLAQEINPEYCNFEMDVFWIKHPGQDPVALLQKYPKRFPLMHLKDREPGTEGNQLGRADVESNVTLGKGDIGIADIMRAAIKAGVKHYFIEDESSRSEEQVPQSLAFLKTRCSIMEISK